LPGLFTDTSEHIVFLLFSFSLFHFFSFLFRAVYEADFCRLLSARQNSFSYRIVSIISDSVGIKANLVSKAKWRKPEDCPADVQVVSGWRRIPAGAEYVERLAVDVVVHETRVDAERAHQQDDVAAAEKHVPDLYNHNTRTHTHTRLMALFTEGKLYNHKRDSKSLG